MTQSLEIAQTVNNPLELQVRAADRIFDLLGVNVEFIPRIDVDVFNGLKRVERLIMHGVIRAEDFDPEMLDGSLDEVTRAAQDFEAKRDQAARYNRLIKEDPSYHNSDVEWTNYVRNCFSSISMLAEYGMISLTGIGIDMEEERFDFLRRRVWIESIMVQARKDPMHLDEAFSGIKHYFRHNEHDSIENYGFSLDELKKLAKKSGHIW